MVDKFKDTLGRWRTQSLFFENYASGTENCLYTLKEYDHEVDGVIYPSLKRLYLEEEDVTEYAFANKYLGGYTHWKVICNTKWFTPHVEEWREELEVKLRSRAIKGIIETAVEGGKDSFTAMKWISDKKWGDKIQPKTKKKEIEEKIDDEIASHIAILDDYRKANE